MWYYVRIRQAGRLRFASYNKEAGSSSTLIIQWHDQHPSVGFDAERNASRHGPPIGLRGEFLPGVHGVSSRDLQVHLMESVRVERTILPVVSQDYAGSETTILEFLEHHIEAVCKPQVRTVSIFLLISNFTRGTSWLLSQATSMNVS